jgi:hypothetical protein
MQIACAATVQMWSSPQLAPGRRHRHRHGCRPDDRRIARFAPVLVGHAAGGGAGGLVTLQKIEGTSLVGSTVQSAA